MNQYQSFGLHKSGKPLPVIKSKTHGNLLLDGLIVEYNKTFSILQFLKKNKYAWVTPKNRLKVVALNQKP